MPIQSALAIVDGRFTELRSSDALACASQIVVGDLGQTNKFIAMEMAGIAFVEKCNVRILGTTFINRLQFEVQLLWIAETDDAIRRIELFTEPFRGDLIEKGLDMCWRVAVVPWKELAPEHRQESVCAKA